MYLYRPKLQIKVHFIIEFAIITDFDQQNRYRWIRNATRKIGTLLIN